MKKMSVLGLLLLTALGMVAVGFSGEEKASKKKSAAKPDQAAIERSRERVQTLDNVYKQTIVLITQKYVDDVDDYPAGSAAVELFKRISKSGNHQVRLIDVTGEPYEPANVAKTEVEKEAVKRFKAGKDYYDQVVMKDGKPYLHAVTPVPVVLERCIMCHSHYADAKKGEAIGAISYQVPIK